MDDFDKESKQTIRFVKASFIFVALLAITMCAGIGFAVYSVLHHLGVL